MIRVDVWLPDPAGVLATGAFGAGALIRVERADVDGFGVLGAYAEVHTIAIVATTLQYQWWDSAGVATSSYKWRVSNAAGATFSPYSAPFAGTNPAGTVVPASYATLAQTLALFETAPNVARQLRLAAALGTAANELNRECGRDYFRHPASSADDATNVWYADGKGLEYVCVHQGIVGLSKLEVSWDLGITFSEITSANYWLTGADPNSTEPVPTDEPYFHARLGPASGLLVFPTGPRTVKLTGASGWGTPPPALVESNAERARQIIYADPSYMGALPSDEAYGAITVPAVWPHVLYRFLERERSRFFCRV